MNGCDDDVDDVVGGGVPVGGMAGMVNSAIFTLVIFIRTIFIRTNTEILQIY